MNYSGSQRCVSAFACLGIIVLFAILAVVWVQFYQGSFRNSSLRYKDVKKDVSINYTISAHQYGKEKTRLKDQRTNSYFGNLDLETDVEYIKPIKLAPLPLHDHDIIFNEMNNYSDEPTSYHHSGHFRHNMAEIWDPHPQYDIEAFGKNLKLQLTHDNNFISPNLYISHAWENYTSRKPHDNSKLGCFYTGNVQGDLESDVVVSLCNGMTGYIRTSEGAYYIEPVEFINGTLNSFLHRIKKVPHTSKNDNEVTETEETTNKCGTNVSDIDSNEIGEEYPIALNLRNPKIMKRNTAVNSNENLNTTSSELPHIRNKRDEDEYYKIMNNDGDVFEENRPKGYFIKVLVVADRSMLEFYKTKDELIDYILTLMSQTSRLFKHPSIGNAISVSVIEIRILEKQDFHSATSQETLTKFCNWRQKYTVTSSHDVALLLTRENLCADRNTECVILGLANIASMCLSNSCAVANDRGLTTAYTIAHEFGHTLSIHHDNDSKGKCANLNKKGGQKYIMTDSLETNVKPWMWSSCSKYYATEFLGSKNAKCLTRPPTTNFISAELSNIPPGEKYDVQKQCEFAFGIGSEHCLFEESLCKQLWCKQNQNDGCLTHQMLWAEGTYCGYGRRCHNDKCILLEENDLMPVNGGWGLWSEWGQCSRTCGGGVRISKRVCDRPVPENGGDYCSGSNIRYSSCNTDPCPDNTDFRAIQCSEFDGNTNNLTNLHKSVKWLPKYGLGKDDQCKLFCRPQNENAYYLLRSKVVDGTKCGFNSFGICVNGKCKSGGCDNVVHSKMELDDCGVCGGDNSQCEEISGSYNITSTSEGYLAIQKFPKGSSSLDIRQRDKKNTKLKNYLALVDGETGKYILNGYHRITEKQKDVIFGGSIIKYSGSNALVERITTAKNEILTKPLILEILTTDSRTPPPDLTYRFIISKENAPKYSWRLYQKEWSKCNSICSGFQFMKPVCIELGNKEQIVDDFYCASRDTHGIVQKQECNNHCRLIWNPTHRGECSVKCGVGERKVSYKCLKIDKEKERYGYLHIITADPYGEEVDDAYCSNLPSPQYTETCIEQCNVRWHYEDWSPCSRTCGGGIQTRIAKCIDNDSNQPLDDENCKELEKVTERQCKTNNCYKWITTDWSQCSEHCGTGFKKRVVTCKSGQKYYDDYYCDLQIKPEETMRCMNKPCVEWAFGDWSPCTVTCGNGLQTREIYCKSIGHQEVLNLSYCKELVKPDSTRSCQLKKCISHPSISMSKYFYPNEERNNSLNYDVKVMKNKWKTSQWSPCSKSCNGGHQYRDVICRGDNDGHSCDQSKIPVSVIDCNTFRCPQWHDKGWSHCDENCEKRRLFICRNDTGYVVHDSQCNENDKIIESTKCRLSQCSHLTNTVPKQYDSSEESSRYRWKVGNWKECSSNCGRGIRKRNVTCEDTYIDVTLVDQYCKNLAKPKTSKPCKRFNCAFTWIESDWSSCSEKCGTGIKTRAVTCHKVYSGGSVDPNPMPDLRYTRYKKKYCNMHRKPQERMTCKESNCGDYYRWKVGPWRDCSQKCGRDGRQTRQIYCVIARTGRGVAKHFCPRNFKPKRKRKCNQWKCAYKSCKDVKNTLGIRDNKDYILDLNGKIAVVYCFKMDTREPEEYISLMSHNQNYAEIYNKRLSNLNTCPYNGHRNDSCDCVDIVSRRSGLTKFYKVRLNITTMKIIGNDFTFTSQEREKRVPYGTAGDCYSKVDKCGQGRFSIDLNGTSFRLTDNVKWVGRISEIHKTDQIISGKCGGFCGECEPDLSTGLQVEVT